MVQGGAAWRRLASTGGSRTKFKESQPCTKVANIMALGDRQTWVQTLILPTTGCVDLGDSSVKYRHIVNIANYNRSKIVLPLRDLGGLLT